MAPMEDEPKIFTRKPRIESADYFERLGLHPDASQAQIEGAYKTLLWHHHPDRGGDAAKAALLGQAYNTLKDSKKRETYRKELLDRHQEHGPDPMNVKAFQQHWMARASGIHQDLHDEFFGRRSKPHKDPNEDA